MEICFLTRSRWLRGLSWCWIGAMVLGTRNNCCGLRAGNEAKVLSCFDFSLSCLTVHGGPVKSRMPNSLRYVVVEQVNCLRLG
jgi:hypothetical protein